MPKYSPLLSHEAPRRESQLFPISHCCFRFGGMVQTNVERDDSQFFFAFILVSGNNMCAHVNQSKCTAHVHVELEIFLTNEKEKKQKNNKSANNNAHNTVIEQVSQSHQ